MATTPSSTVPSAPALDEQDIWNPTQYLLFDEMRSRPGQELIGRVLHTLTTFKQDASSIKKAVDLGCGTGKLALQLAQRFPEARVEGVDSSQNMLQQAREATAKQSEGVQIRVTWKRAGFQEFTSTDADGVDLIYSNAALHWDHDHATLFPRLMKQLREPGGILAVQMPNNFREPSHQCMLQALKDGAFFSESDLEKLWKNQPDVHLDGQKHYYHLLRPHARHIDMWQTQYLQPISSTTKYHPVLEWTKSTALAPILAGLPSEAGRTRFQEIYSALLEKAYPYFEGKQGKQVIFPFKRIFMIAMK